MENRWLCELAENNHFKNSAILPGNFLEEWDNAASWNGWLYGDVNHWQDTHLYTPKQMRERFLEAVKRAEERRKIFLESTTEIEDDL